MFEATIRERVLAEVEAELPPLRHVAIKRAFDEMKEGIEHGSFFKVLEPYKDLDAGLIEQVNQVRNQREPEPAEIFLRGTLDREGPSLAGMRVEQVCLADMPALTPSPHSNYDNGTSYVSLLAQPSYAGTIASVL